MADDTLRAFEQSIAAGALPPGTRLPGERELAARHGCSRAALRESLQRLRAQGLVVTRRGAGSVVARAQPAPLLRLLAQSPRSRQELLEVRDAIDAMAAAGAAERASADDLAEIRRQHRRFGAALRRGALEAMGRADAGFHLAVATASRNQVLLEVVRSLREALEASIAISAERLFEHTDFAETVYRQHGAILAAIARGDAEAAQRASREHVRETARQLRSVGRGAADRH